MYRKKDLKDAKKELKCLRKQKSNSDNGLSKKWRKAFDAAMERVQEIEWDLKRQGKLSTTSIERLHLALDGKYPNAKHRSVKKYKGKEYEVIYRRKRKSGSPALGAKADHAWVLYKPGKKGSK